MPARKSKTEEIESPVYPKASYIFKPERCANHRFAMDLDGKADFTKKNVTDDDRCISCGLYFSTWAWYADRHNDAYRKGIDNESGQLINFIAKEADAITDKVTKKWAEDLLTKIRERRITNARKLLGKTNS